MIFYLISSPHMFNLLRVSCHPIKHKSFILINYIYVSKNNVCNSVLSPPWRILFFGTDNFSVKSLKELFNQLEKGIHVKQLEVVTSLKSKTNPVWQFAVQQNLPLHSWPIQATPKDFDIGLVVSFGHLIPNHVITSFPLGMLNVHASLLPRWRGAAPIIHAIMHGDTQTGVTIMKIRPHKFDVGEVLMQSCCHISPDDTLPELSNRLACLGSELLGQCVKELPQSLDLAKPQPQTGITYAPKVTASTAVVRWRDLNSTQVYNLYRALSGVFPLYTTYQGLPIKLYNGTLPLPIVDSITRDKSPNPGFVDFHRPSGVLRVMCADGYWVAFHSIGVPRKKPISAADFYNGYLSKTKESERVFE
uniref:Methionyl-tRNA formyltransferase, mitochondrial n=1 Tax=Timema shepardi TaxID=629360 RepID=A0A7R9FZN9_TIMSH|nr:unnamed protein product [Timema shepardi]